jgi:hypothetical protein
VHEYVCSGDNYIQALMEQQVSWAAGRGLTFISVVQLALSVLNRLMVLKDSIKVQLCLELSYKH